MFAALYVGMVSILIQTERQAWQAGMVQEGLAASVAAGRADHGKTDPVAIKAFGRFGVGDGGVKCGDEFITVALQPLTFIPEPDPDHVPLRIADFSFQLTEHQKQADGSNFVRRHRVQAATLWPFLAACDASTLRP